MNIDYLRPLVKKIGPGGISIFMYKDDPGRYLTAYGTEVAEDLARTAGFDIEKLRKSGLRIARMQEAKRLIEKEFAETDGSLGVVEKTVNGFTVVALGAGRYDVRDPEGNRLNTVPLPKDVAENLVEQLAKPRPPATPPTQLPPGSPPAGAPKPRTPFAPGDRALPPVDITRPTSSSP